MHDKQNIILLAILAATGGIARFLVSRMEPDAPILSMRKFISFLFANVFVSGFSGYMGAIAMSVVTPDHAWHTIAAGVFGFMGAKGLELLADKVSDKV